MLERTITSTRPSSSTSWSTISPTWNSAAMSTSVAHNGLSNGANFPPPVKPLPPDWRNQ